MEPIDRFKNQDGEIDFRAWLSQKPTPSPETKTTTVSLDPVENAYQLIEAKLDQKIKDWKEPDDLPPTLLRVFLTLKQAMYRRHRILMVGASKTLLYPGEVLLDCHARAKALNTSYSTLADNVRYLEHAGLVERSVAGRNTIVRLLPFYIGDAPPIDTKYLEKMDRNRIETDRQFYAKQWGDKGWKEREKMRNGELTYIAKQIIMDFVELYKDKFGTNPTRKFGADDRAAKWIYTNVGNNRNMILDIFKEYFLDDSTWLVAAGHPLYLIQRKFHSYRLAVERMRVI